MINTAIITLSDRAYRGEREDLTGPELKRFIENNKDYSVKEEVLIPDECEKLRDILIDMCDNKKYDFIVTNGGTGLSKRDITPETTLSIIDREVPGISEYMRMKSSAITKRAVLSRGICGIRKESLIINLPGSPKGALENIESIIDIIPHAIDTIKGNVSDCGKCIKNDR
ncbi:MogA/MoaB family molybdenum cofactor biosynthesis protein [Peptacetobacter hominis]|uniref:MogA/MoaB family molybdenum cofactor biosynthesis protein n=1 Tax=Peptacetobacter hominis TaxID=2743610 RepID=A0A544QW99_9FIRM|nr:MogA/MoaB family molybdenum cofactor biosynthesis protein [Peptacetobacter hominis]TQQ84969.1 MogA/MoaB family molybdenum cofactor biosynthesis protein [Peptacetobacter hominis]